MKKKREQIYLQQAEIIKRVAEIDAYTQNNSISEAIERHIENSMFPGHKDAKWLFQNLFTKEIPVVKMFENIFLYLSTDELNAKPAYKADADIIRLFSHWQDMLESNYDLEILNRETKYFMWYVENVYELINEKHDPQNYKYFKNSFNVFRETLEYAPLTAVREFTSHVLISFDVVRHYTGTFKALMSMCRMLKGSNIIDMKSKILQWVRDIAFKWENNTI